MKKDGLIVFPVITAPECKGIPKKNRNKFFTGCDQTVKKLFPAIAYLQVSGQENEPPAKTV
jgi:hypothetical protein